MMMLGIAAGWLVTAGVTVAAEVWKSGRNCRA
jgi:hypothetical protein